MRTKTVRILNIVAGILLIAAGIYCLCNEGSYSNSFYRCFLLG